jgi:aspartate aminotransferase
MNAPQHPFDASAALSRRIGRIKMNPIIRTLNQVRALELSGHKLANFSVGEPDFDTPLHIQEAAIAAMRRGETRYTTSDGTAALKEAIQRKFRRENRLDYALPQLTVGSGAKQVIYNALVCTLNEGDEVIVPAPYWTTYPEVVTVCDGTPVIVNCSRGERFKLRPEALERAITPRTKWLILNSPSNPTGSVYTTAELRALADVLLRHPQVMVMSDDMYEHLLYDGESFATIAQVEPALYERTLTVNGVSKTYAMTGWRIGYAGGPAALIKAMAAIQSQATSNPCSISQAAAAVALDGPQEIVAERNSVFQKRRDRMVGLLNKVPGFSCDSPKGAFYAYVDCSALIGRRTPQGAQIAHDTALATYLLEYGGVALVQGAGFGLSPYLRLSYAASFEEIEEGCRRLREACAALS